MGRRRIARALLALFLTAFLLAGSLPAQSAVSASLGTASGIRAVELSLDGGKMWMPLDKRSLPILESTDIRSASGSAVLDLADGSRLIVQPFSALRIRQTAKTVDVVLDLGRLGFRLPADSRVTIATATAKLRPSQSGVQEGEVAVVAGGVVGVRMMQGSATVQELVGAKRTMLASLEPVFLPTKPEGADLFRNATASISGGGKAVFTPKGESLGYLDGKGGLVVEPGYTRDLTGPFPGKLVQAVTARVPESVRKEAVPVFDVNGGWVGYLVGPTFHGQDQASSGASTQGSRGGLGGGSTATWAMAAGGIASIAGGVGVAAAVARPKPPPASVYKPNGF